MNETTDERIIHHAIPLFAHHGYEGTSIRAITRAAGANLGAVTYHFGSKRALYGRVLERCMGPLAERVREALGGRGDALERLESVMGVFFGYLRERPELPQLMLQETAAGRMPPPEALAVMRSILGGMAAVVEEGQATGSIRAGDPRLMAVSLISQPLHLTVATRLLEGIQPDDPVTRRRLMSHATAFIRQGLSPAAGPSGAERGAR